MSQKTQILSYLKTGKSVTQLDAIARFGCLRLGGRIFELRKAGHAIETERFTTPNGSVVARYRLVS